VIVQATVDWISATYESGPEYPDNYALSGKFLDNGLLGYDRAFQYHDGRLELTHTRRPEMGYHVQLSGSVIRRCHADYGHTPVGQLIWHGKRARKLTRFDIAIDAIESGLSLQRLTALLSMATDNGAEERPVRTRALSAPLIKDTRGNGYTQYIGSMSSDAYLRIYDKTAEQESKGVLDAPQNWIRIEAVFKGDKVNPAFRAIESGESFASLVCGIADFRDEHWRAIMKEKPLPVKAVREPSKTALWLMDVITGVVANQEKENPGFLGEFIAEIVRRVENS